VLNQCTDVKYDDVSEKCADEADGRRRGTAPARRNRLTLYEPNVSGAWTLLRFLRSEFDALTFAE
jgi:hypothetical protein